MIGDLISAFSGTPTYKPQYSSEGLHNLTDALTGQASTNLGSNNANLTAYEKALGDQQSPINDAVNRYSDLAKSIASRPNAPLDEYKNLGDYLFGKVDSNAVDPVINNLANQTNLHNRVLGINPGGDSTYDRLMRSGIASKIRLSALGNIVNQLGPTASSLNNSRLANDAFALGLTPQEMALRNAAAGQNLLPIQARGASLQDLINSGQGLSALNKSNIFGYQKERTGLDRWSDAFNALKNGAWEGLSFYQSLGGMGGGMGGGGGGGGGMGGMFGGMGGGGGGQGHQVPIGAQNQLMQFGGMGGGGYGGQGFSPGMMNQGASALGYGGGVDPYSYYNYAPYSSSVYSSWAPYEGGI